MMFLDMITVSLIWKITINCNAERRLKLWDTQDIGIEQRRRLMQI